MYSLVITVNNTILYPWNLLRVDCKHSHTKKVIMEGDECVNELDCGSPFTMYPHIKPCYTHAGMRGERKGEIPGWAILKKPTVWGDKQDQSERKLTEPNLRASQTQRLSKPGISSTSRATECFGVWRFCGFSVFVFSWSAQTGPTGPCTLFCSWLQFLSPPTPGPTKSCYRYDLCDLIRSWWIEEQGGSTKSYPTDGECEEFTPGLQGQSFPNCHFEAPNLWMREFNFLHRQARSLETEDLRDQLLRESRHPHQGKSHLWK